MNFNVRVIPRDENYRYTPFREFYYYESNPDCFFVDIYLFTQYTTGTQEFLSFADHLEFSGPNLLPNPTVDITILLFGGGVIDWEIFALGNWVNDSYEVGLAGTLHVISQFE